MFQTDGWWKSFFFLPPAPSQLNAVLCPGLGQSSSPWEEMFDQGDEGNTWGVRRGGWVGTWSWHLIWGSRFGAQLPMIGNCTLKNKRCCWGCCFWCWIRHGFVCEWTVAATRWMINLAKCLDNLISLCELLTVFCVHRGVAGSMGLGIYFFTIQTAFFLIQYKYLSEVVQSILVLN